MKNIWIILCLLALSTPVAQVIVESNKNEGAIFITAIVAGIGLLGILLRNKMFPNNYQYSHPQ